MEITNVVVPTIVTTYEKEVLLLSIGAFQAAAPVGTDVEVVVWNPEAQVHLIVSPTLALMLEGVNAKSATETVLIVAFAAVNADKTNNNV
jgi:hypothetical protein